MVSWPQSIAQLENSYLSSVQSLSRVRLFVTPGTKARQASLSITNSRSSLKLMSTESVMPHYSAIKRNTFESVLMRWMNLEPIIQGEK